MKSYIYSENGLYYFNVKNKGTFGPYLYEEDAEEAANSFKKKISKPKCKPTITKVFYLTPEELKKKREQYKYKEKIND